MNEKEIEFKKKGKIRLKLFSNNNSDEEENNMNNECSKNNNTYKKTPK